MRRFEPRANLAQILSFDSLAVWLAATLENKHWAFRAVVVRRCAGQNTAATSRSPAGRRRNDGETDQTSSMSAYGYRDGYAPRRHTDDRRPREERHREHDDSRSRAPARSRLAGPLPGPPAPAPEPEAAAPLPPPPALPPAPGVAPLKPVEPKEPPLDRTKVCSCRPWRCRRGGSLSFINLSSRTQQRQSHMTLSLHIRWPH